MSKQRVCDFCLSSSWWNVIKVRGKRFHFVPGILGAATYKLELCNDCYENMKKYVVRMKGAKL